MSIENRLTILTGPPPRFFLSETSTMTGWPLTILEQDHPPLGKEMMVRENEETFRQNEQKFTIVQTILNIPNGPDIARHFRAAWDQNVQMELQYRDLIGLTQVAPIIALRNIPVDERNVLILWLKVTYDQYMAMRPPGEPE